MKQVTNFQLLTLLLVLCTSFLTAQTTWNGGGGNTAWDNPLNWTAGVPDATVHVIIPGGATVIISTAALAKSVDNQGDLTIQVNSSLTIDASTSHGIYNQGSVNNEGDINIDNAGNRAIDNRGNFTNDNNIYIGQNAGPGNITYDGIINYSVFSNNGHLTIDNVGERGISNWVGGDFTNTGIIDIGQNGGVGNISKDGISNGYGGAATITNTGGTINIDNTQFQGILNSSGTFTNSSTINIGKNAGNIGHSGIYQPGGTFTNDGGTIDIDNAILFSGIHLSNSIFENKNNGQIFIGQVDGIGRYGLYLGNSTFTNNSSILNIDNIGINSASYDGILCTSQSEFKNMNGGQVAIGQNSTLPSEGISCGNSAKLINDASSITIDNAVRFALELWSGGEFENKNGALCLIGQNDGNIGSSGIQTWYGVAKIDNSSNAEIRIDNTGTNGINNTGGIFTNSSTINIGKNAGNIGHSGIYQPGGSFTNDGGTIDIDNAILFSGIHLSNSIFENKNNGQILIGQVNGVGRMGLYTGNATFMNSSGSIIIDNTGSHGLSNNAGNFTNSATINIGQNAGNIGAHGFYEENGGTFNNDSGSIKIDNTLNNGLLLVGSIFENKNNGQVLIGQLGSSNMSDGIILFSSNFTNDGSTIKIDNANHDAIAIKDLTFENKNGGEILIGQTGPIGGTGIFLFHSATFINDGSTISIDNSGIGYWSQGTNTATNKNGGQIYIDQNGLIANYGFVNFGGNVFNNLDCSEIYLYKRIYNEGIINNTGLLSINTNESHANSGTFTNNGIIEIIQLPEVPNIINNDLIIAPINGFCFIGNALQIGGANSFTALSQWYFDQSLSNPAGNYDQSANELSLYNLNNGVNTLYFTVDGNGCSFPVSIQLTVDEVQVNKADESCQGMADGSINLLIQSASGQVGYSIDGGVNFQFNGQFNNLSAGTFNWVVKVFGTSNNCEKTGTVTINGGSPAPIWYLDADGDGFTDNNVTPLASCSQPPGYIATQSALSDCNDGNATVYPGAPELCDGLDNDCDGQLLAGEVDADGDGYMVCENDCDDSDPDVNPGATEICNGIDDDCDGEIDEGVGSGLTWTGNVTFTTQAEVDAWLACYSIIDGSLTIMGAGITDLSSLIGLEEVTGLVFIYANGSLASLDGLDNLATVGSGLSIYYNFALTDCCAIYDLLNNGGVTGAITIFFNASGCNSQSEILSGCAPPSFTGGGQQESAWDLNSVQDMSLFPNPASGTFSVRIPENTGKGQLSVVDIHGREMMGQKTMEGRATYPFERGTLAPGIYMVVLKTGGKAVLAKRLVIE